jgi:ATP-dependent DNA ligase
VERTVYRISKSCTRTREMTMCFSTPLTCSNSTALTLRQEALEKRKGTLEKLLANSGWGMRFVEHMVGDGQTIFSHACKLKLEGIVSKRRDSGYRSGPGKSWIKTKNPAAPATMRVIEEGVW